MYLCQWWRLLVSPMCFLQRSVDTLSTSTTPRYHRWSKIFLWHMRRCRNVKSVPVAGYTFATMSLCHMNTHTHKTQKIFMSVEMLERDRESMLKVRSILQSSTCKYPPAHQTGPKTISFKHLEGRTPFLRSTFSKSDVESKTMPGKGTSLFACCYLSTYESNQQSTSW